MNTKYQIVKDQDLGFEVQIKRWWFPFWCQCWEPGLITNTHNSLKKAKQFIYSRGFNGNITIKCQEEKYIMKDVERRKGRMDSIG